MNSTDTFRQARNFLLLNRENYEKAYRDFRWPEFETFNWALDWFDVYAGENPNQQALWLYRDNDNQVKMTYGELADRSARVASYLKEHGVLRGDRIMMMLPNVTAIWELMLAAMKIGAVLVPTSPQATVSDLADRITRADIKFVVTDQHGSEKIDRIECNLTKIKIGDTHSSATPQWLRYEDSLSSPKFIPSEITLPDDPFLIYFTSGTTAKPKIVLHTHRSYPVGHLSTMYWIGIKEGDIHQNISSPGWAKHAWSSFFAPWNAGATVFVHDYQRFNPGTTLRLLDQNGINTFCAPPTVWRMFNRNSLGDRPRGLRELVSAGEPLNPEVIQRVQQAWGITIRDGYGQTETTAQIGNTPGQPVQLGSMGRVLPGYEVALINANGEQGVEGEIALQLKNRPAGLMKGYLNGSSQTVTEIAGDLYRTSDEAMMDDKGYFRFIGRGDDVFKSSDYKISPFELESTLIEHNSVTEAAVVPSPDPIRLCVPKAFVVLKPDEPDTAAVARAILSFANARLAPFQKIRRIEFSTLPKTSSGKIRRIELRNEEIERRSNNLRGDKEYWLEDLS